MLLRTFRPRVQLDLRLRGEGAEYLRGPLGLPAGAVFHHLIQLTSASRSVCKGLYENIRAAS